MGRNRCGQLKPILHYSQARTPVEEGLKRFPGNIYLEMMAATIRFDLKDYAEARTSCIRLLERFGEIAGSDRESACRERGCVQNTLLMEPIKSDWRLVFSTNRTWSEPGCLSPNILDRRNDCSVRKGLVLKGARSSVG